MRALFTVSVASVIFSAAGFHVQPPTRLGPASRSWPGLTSSPTCTCQAGWRAFRAGAVLSAKDRESEGSSEAESAGQWSRERSTQRKKATPPAKRKESGTRSRSPEIMLRGEWRHSAGILVDEHSIERDGKGAASDEKPDRRGSSSADPQASDAQTAALGRREQTGVVDALESTAPGAPEATRRRMAAALTAHLASRDQCRVGAEEAWAVEEAFAGLDDIFYADGGWVLPEDESAEILKQGGNPTYGELLPAGVDKLFAILGLDQTSSFYDLGAGTGRSLLQVAMMQPDMRRAVGVELSATRLEYGEVALQRLRQLNATICPVELREGDIGDNTYPDATHAFVSSVCFDDALLRKIARNLGLNANFRVMVSLRQLPIQPYLVLLGRTFLPCTFHGRQPSYVYVRPGLHGTPAATMAEFLCDSGCCWLPPHFQGDVETPFIGEA